MPNQEIIYTGEKFLSFRLKFDGSNEESQVFSALQFAGRLNFRPGVSKTFIMITCGNPATDMDGAFFGDALTMLREQNITLHLLSHQKLAFPGYHKASLVSKILGYDSNEIFTTDNLSYSSLRRQLKIPKNYVATLAPESGGSAFNIGKLSNTLGALKVKTAGTVMANKIALTAEPSSCQVCDCLANRDGRGSLQCHRCILPQVDFVLQNWKHYSKER